MINEIQYTQSYRKIFNSITIETLEDLNIFLNERIYSNSNYSKKQFNFDSGDFNFCTSTFNDILKNEKFISRFNKNFSLSIGLYDDSYKNSFCLTISKNSDVEVRCYIVSHREDIALGQKEVIQNFIEQRFINNIEKEVQETPPNITNEEINDGQVTNKYSINTIKKDLIWNIPSLKLTLDDMKYIESLLKQDLNEISNYEIIIKPIKKYLKKFPKSKQYVFGSVAKLETNKELLKNIKYYSIKFDMEADEIHITIDFDKDNYFSCEFSASGENQTLYYGKYKLIKDYLSIKKTIYSFMYSKIYAYYVCPILLILGVWISLYSLIYLILGNLWIQLIEAVCIIVLICLSLYFAPLIFEKYRFSLLRENEQKFNILGFVLTIPSGIIAAFLYDILKHIFGNN